ncbi:Crp/Fnr family transcriptional regulator [Brevibacillus fluminis]|uniref:Crp/Fnr family transcriptional regulator n=1 Tax=Brevibacillus fluminis TaxID=511487 RepID=A0A3M8DQN0_9BACL|nr:Crp/Fnr family transcriptional regulator [Brevibacillus fluminis]RNB89745.1 Crp/Fnr family transcriptional regulator [Brevibacillus fluminis]
MQLAHWTKTHTWLAYMLTDIPVDIQSHFLARKFSSRTVICKKGEPIISVYILCSGTMRVVNEFDSGHLYAFTDVNPYILIGDTEILADEGVFACTVESVTDCLAVQMSREDFLACFEHSHVFAKEVAKTIASKVHSRSLSIGENMYYSILFNLASLLIQLAQPELADKRAFLLPLNRQHLAERLGASVRSVNRAIRKLKEEGYLSIVKGKIMIVQDQLVRLAEVVDQFK